jgi:L-seryl-tRNA(Ser) seleniumtransferase
LAVNNNAAALILVLAALAGGGSAAVSRGELIEIGGSFRLPDIMAVSGATLVEVGTTNRTRRSDYEAVAADVRLVLKVHPSNYRVEGFAEQATWAELADVAARAGIPFVADVGSGLLDIRVPWLSGGPPPWLDGEPGVRQTLESGASLVVFSGDKLLGGPQAGLVVGERKLVRAVANHPLARALRTDAATQAALAATLELYASGRGNEIPFWHMATLDYAGLERRHEAVVGEAGVAAEVVADASLPGAGSVPGKTIPSPAIRVSGRADDSWHRLLAADPPIVARRRDDALFVDLRTVDPADDTVVAKALAGLD